jgi:hypothetical protein
VSEGLKERTHLTEVVQGPEEALELKQRQRFVHETVVDEVLEREEFFGR